MAKQLDKKILDQIELITPPAKKELKFIQEKDWTAESKLNKREEMYNLQHMINSRNIDALLKLHSLAAEDLNHPKVKSTIKLLLGFYFILEDRYKVMDKKFDWTKFLDDENAQEGKGQTAEKKQAAEIEFQVGVLKDYSKFREQLRKINFGEEDVSVDIPIHGDKPIPIIMKEVIENRYPEIKEFIEKRKEEQQDDSV